MERGVTQTALSMPTSSRTSVILSCPLRGFEVDVLDQLPNRVSGFRAVRFVAPRTVASLVLWTLKLSESQRIEILKAAQGGVPVADLFGKKGSPGPRSSSGPQHAEDVSRRSVPGRRASGSQTLALLPSGGGGNFFSRRANPPDSPTVPRSSRRVAVAEGHVGGPRRGGGVGGGGNSEPDRRNCSEKRKKRWWRRRELSCLAAQPTTELNDCRRTPPWRSQGGGGGGS